MVGNASLGMVGLFGRGFTESLSFGKGENYWGEHWLKHLIICGGEAGSMHTLLVIGSYKRI